MCFSLGKVSLVCAVLTFILTLHCGTGDFQYDHVFEDEIKHEKQQHIVGGQKVIPHEEFYKYKDLLEDILKKAAGELNQGEVFNLDSLQVTSQVVQGVLYHVNVDVKQESCSHNCTVKHCTFEIWSRVWLPEEEKLKMKQFHCTRV